MRKLKLFMTALALIGGTNFALAQTDVTSTYITNADFSQGTPITVGVCTYEKDKASNGTEYSQLVPVEGWDIPANGDARAGGLVAFGSGVWIGGPGYNAPATNSDGVAEGNILGLVGVWTGTAQYTQDATLPAGKYTLVLGVYNSKGGTTAFTKNLIGFIEDGGTEHLASTTVYSVNTWKYEFITFELAAETSGKFTLGYQGSNVGSGSAQHLFLSGIQLFDGEVDAEDYEAQKALKRKKGEWAVALQNANNALTAYTYVVGDERAALEAEVAKAEPTTLEGYEAAISALTSTLSAFNDAKASFDALEAAKAAETPDLAYAAAAKKTALTDAKDVTATSKADAEEKTAAIYQALRAYYESHALAENVDGAVDMTESITNYNATDGNNGWTWTGNKNNPRNTESWTDSNGKNDYMYFDGGNWSGTGWTTTMEQAITIPAGRYLLTAKGRASDGVTLTMSVGEESIELPNVNATGNVFNRGWCDGSVEFETNGDPITIFVKATTAGYQQWFSVGDFRLVQLEENEVPMADEADYAALDEAFAPYQILELGFDEDEYAPYNNVDVILLGIEIDDLEEEKIQNKEYTKEYIQGLTARVYDILLFPNETEMNAIYDGDLANAPIQATSENVVLPGWVTKSGNTRQTFKGNGENGKACLGENEVGLFVHPGVYNYGETTGYTMPLKADTWYVASAKYCAWANGSNNNFTLTILKGSETVATKSYGPNATACTEANALKEVKLYFKTSDAADYVLSVNANGNTFMTGFHITKAVAEDITISEDATEAPAASEYANVTLTRTLSSSYWNTFSVPFDMVIPEGWTVKEFVNAEDNTLNFSAATSIQAGVPYLVKTEADVVNPTFEGVTVEATEGLTIGTGDYKFAAQIYNKDLATDGTIAYLATDGTIKKLTSGGLKGLRAYFIIPASSAGARIAFIDDGGTTTGIESMASEVQKVENGVYDLQGRRVEAMKKGLYIVNGKKVVK